MMRNEHQPVLLDEVIEGLNINASGIYVDATFGRGGHSLAILKCLGPAGRVIALDKDPEAVTYGEKGPTQEDPRFVIEHADFSEMERVITNRGLVGQISGVLMDLGVSSPQLNQPERGFSFLHNGPLDMRMDTTQHKDAAMWVNTATEAEIASTLKEYGEERFAKRIANAIIRRRTQQIFSTTHELAQVIAEAVPFREPHKHPATRSFQAIRIIVNREVEALKNGLEQSVNLLAPGGRLCVISFHSLEDRMVKRFIQRESEGELLPRRFPIQQHQAKQRLVKIGKMVVPTEGEIKQNSRARSARLRIAEKR